MADTLVANLVDLTGSSSTGLGFPYVAFTYGVVQVTNLGSCRKMDIDDPSRLFDFGWFSFTQPGPGTAPVSSAEMFSRPIWVEFEVMQLPFQFDYSFDKEFYADAIRWSFNTGCHIQLTLWHV